MKIFEFSAGGGNPNSFSANDNNGLVSNGNHTQVYYLFDIPEGYYIEGYYIALITRTNGNRQGQKPSSSLYNHLITYGEGSNARSEVLTQPTDTSGVFNSTATISYNGFNREVPVKQRLVYDNGLSALGVGEYGYRTSLGIARKYAIMCFHSYPGFSNTDVFKGGYIKYSRKT